jgi:hypothetical protein
VIAKITLLVIFSVLAAAILETTIRALDGYRLDSIRLSRQNSATASPVSASVDAYARRLSTDPSVEASWFALDPAEPTGGLTTPDALLVKRYQDNPGLELESVYEWNDRYVRWGSCDALDYYELVFKRLNDVFAFSPLEPDRYPPFRFLRSSVYPSGLRTNRFGWRSRDITLDKPADVVRLAFVGASTTIAPHSDRFAYPDYIETWLNRWAGARGGRVRFEIVNAAREGIDTSAIAAIVRQELVPIEPDLVVFYEGANHFWPADFVDFPAGVVPRRPPATFTRPWRLSRMSAAAARLQKIVVQPGLDDAEPSKPRVSVSWPRDLDEADPALENPKLPVALPLILRNLESMRTALEAVGGELVVSSFVWLASEGLRLDRRAHPDVYRYLNSTMWPFTYAHVRRYADFQNRVLAKYAKTRRLAFLDVAAGYPSDPSLFGDPVHMTPAGIKLMAWIAFQQLVPVIAERLERGRLPVADRQPSTAHPGFAGANRLLRIETVRAQCG